MTKVSENASNDNGDPVEALTKALAAAIEERSAGRGFSERELAALEVSNEAVRRLLEAQLQQLADDEPSEIVLNGGAYRRHQIGRVKYHSLCGPLIVERWTHREVGVRNGPTIVPLDLCAGLIERATPALAYAIAHGYARSPMRHVEQDLIVARRVPPSRSTLERAAKAIGTDAKAVLLEIERKVRAHEAIPADTSGITLGLDRTSIPMEEAADDETVTKTRLRRLKGQRRRPPPTTVRYRMGYVGTVALTNREGAVLASWRYAAAAHEGPSSVVARMMSDLRRSLRLRPMLHVGVVQDGASEVWNLLQPALQNEPLVKKWHEAVDCYHLFERLAHALEIVMPDEVARRRKLERWKRALIRDDRAIFDIQHFFNVSLTRPWRRTGWTERQEREVSKLLGCYLADHWFRYASMVKLGLHIGSGVTEGACKSLIAARAKRSGQRWHKEGIDAVLTLRSLVFSNRFDRFWRHFVKRYRPLENAA